MNVLVIGSGGREHAICWKLRQSADLKELYCAPGNPGTARVATNVDLAVDDLEGLLSFARQKAIDLTIVGPEYPLSLGIVDVFRKAGMRIFGPTREAAQLESSKHFAKQVMLESGVKTADCKVFTNAADTVAYLEGCQLPVVLKADGLAAGKGVFICHSADEWKSAINYLFNELKADKLLVESFLQGKEASFIVATDGERIVPLASSHDYKRIADNDQGLNTGGMGTVSPTPNIGEVSESELVDTVIRPVLRKMKEKGVPFQGFLYAGLMITPAKEVFILEYNTRLGDPETQVIMRRMDGDLLKVLSSLSSDSAEELPELGWKPGSAVCVVQASRGYPSQPVYGDEISGIELAESLPEVVVFHAGTRLNDGRLLTAGGRVLNVTAVGESRDKARAQAYRAADMIQFAGRQMRRDIAK